MRAKKYLGQIERLDNDVNAMFEQLEELNAVATRITSRPNIVQVQETNRQDRLGDTVTKMIDLENKLLTTIGELIDFKRKVIQKVDGLENSDYILLLWLRYINFKTWAEIAETMGITPSWVHVLHRRALAEFEKALKGCGC